MDYITEIELGRDRHYMRGGGNILVRQNRIKKGIVKVLLYLLLVAFVSSLIIVGAKEVYFYLMTTTDLDVRHIRISGNKCVSKETLKDFLSPLLNRNILSIDLDQWKRKIRLNPWIEDVSIKRDLPSTLIVEIKERTPAAFFLWKGKTYLADANGVPIDQYRPERFRYDLPFVTGIEAQSIKDALRKLCAGMEILKEIKRQRSSFLERISEINLKEKNFIIIGLRDGSPPLYLDQENFQENLDHYLSIREDINRHFKKMEYIDLRWKDMVVVKPLTISR